jgi:predicted small lipoprotein YifL
LKLKKGRFLVIFCLVFPVLLACGKKGPPFLPESNITLTVRELSAQWKNGTVFLVGRIADFRGEKRERSQIRGCRVYHAWYALEKQPCDGCPVDYSGYREINDEVLRGEEFFCEVTLNKKEGTHFFEVRLIGQGGAAGPPSNRTKLIIAK